MASLLRSRSVRAIIPTTSRFPVFLQQQFYGQSSYGDGETNPRDDRNAPTRDMEHPGAPPPNVGKENSKSQPSYKQDESRSGVLEEDIPNKQSNKAKPVINDGRQPSNLNEEGNTKPNAPKDVKEHNEEIDQRHDKPYNRVNDGEKVGKGFWGKLDGAEGY
ncbi:hypothetical protein BDV10DRAFT_181539 [Aspergillus recurvatus]